MAGSYPVKFTATTPTQSASETLTPKAVVLQGTLGSHLSCIGSTNGTSFVYVSGGTGQYSSLTVSIAPTPAWDGESTASFRSFGLINNDVTLTGGYILGTPNNAIETVMVTVTVNDAQSVTVPWTIVNLCTGP